MIAHDGEGATKFLEVNVTGAATWEDAKTAAMAIAKSPLVKTAFFGEDPNWGRIVCAAGYSGAAMEADKVNLSIGGIRLVENGMNCNVPAEKLAPTMAEHDISMSIDLGAGEESATVWTCDFSYEYVKINGEYHTLERSNNKYKKMREDITYVNERTTSTYLNGSTAVSEQF